MVYCDRSILTVPEHLFAGQICPKGGPQAGAPALEEVRTCTVTVVDCTTTSGQTLPVISGTAVVCAVPSASFNDRTNHTNREVMKCL